MSVPQQLNFDYENKSNSIGSASSTRRKVNIHIDKPLSGYNSCLYITDYLKLDENIEKTPKKFNRDSLYKGDVELHVSDVETESEDADFTYLTSRGELSEQFQKEELQI